jgi:iron complex transport system substrate-binding protein
MRAGVRSLGPIVVLAIVAACGGVASSPTSASSGSPQAASPAASRAAPAPSPITIRDDAGRVVALPAPPKRIVSASPSTTELAFAAGLGDEIVAVDKFSNYPPEATSRTSIGGYIDPDLETILGAHPDLVLATDVHLAKLVPTLEKQGIPTVVLAAKNIEGVLLDLLLLGRVAGDEVEAERVVADLRTRIAAVETRVARSDPVSVFYELDPTLFTAGPAPSSTTSSGEPAAATSPRPRPSRIRS